MLTRHWQRETGKFFPPEVLRPVLYEDISATATATATGAATGKTTAAGAGSRAGSNAHTDAGSDCGHSDDSDGGYYRYGGDVVIVSYEALRRDKGGFFTRDHHHNSGDGNGNGNANGSAPTSWLAVVLDEVCYPKQNKSLPSLSLYTP